MAVNMSTLIGKGPAFPYNKSSTGGLAYSEDIERINHSLFILFETPKYTRLMMPEFGSDLRKYRFDPLDRVLMERVRYTITEDIKKWEPRISLTGIEFLSEKDGLEPNVLYVSISYRIINTAVDANYVYPYKLGTYDTNNISY